MSPKTWPCAGILWLAACDAASGEDGRTGFEHDEPLDPATAPRAAVDRFAAARADNPGVPDPDAPIDFDDGFLHRGLSPSGGPVAYYGLGGASGFTMPAYQLVDAQGQPVPEQLTILAELPGAVAYSDFWQRVEVEVPRGYVANTITRAEQLALAAYPQTLTADVYNHPVVPRGSTADLAVTDTQVPLQAWFDDQVVEALAFAEAPVRVRGSLVDYASVYVCREDDGAFCTEADGTTRNVVDAIPGDPTYSPLWRVKVYPRSAFDSVTDLPSAQASAQAAGSADGSGLANCPVVEW